MKEILALFQFGNLKAHWNFSKYIENSAVFGRIYFGVRKKKLFCHNNAWRKMVELICQIKTPSKRKREDGIWSVILWLSFVQQNTQNF